MSKHAALLLIAALTLSALLMVKAAPASAYTTPSVPEFTVKYVDYSYDVPSTTTTTIDEYTGKEIVTIHPGYHVENKSIEIAIKNQPLTAYTDADGNRIYLYYNVRVKGHFGENWAVQSEIPVDPGPYTVLTHSIDYPIDYPEGAQVDFQVEAFFGGFHAEYIGHSIAVLVWSFKIDSSSGWSDTQTLTIDTIPPSITLLSPQEGKVSTSDVPLDFAVNEPVSQAAYSLDGAGNVTVAGNTTLPGLPVGEHNLTVYAWDAAGNVGSSENLVFTVAAITPFHTVLVAAAVVAVAVAAVGLLLYFKKRKR